MTITTQTYSVIVVDRKKLTAKRIETKGRDHAVDLAHKYKNHTRFLVVPVVKTTVEIDKPLNFE